LNALAAKAQDQPACYDLLVAFVAAGFNRLAGNRAPLNTP